jgi:hypothetical protein
MLRESGKGEIDRFVKERIDGSFLFVWVDIFKRFFLGANGCTRIRGG